METEKMRQAILQKAEQEATDILHSARAKAQELIEHATKARDHRFEERKDRILGEARQESEKILAKGNVDARLAVLKQKDSLLEQVILQAKSELSKNTMQKQSWEKMIRETISGLDKSHKIRLQVSPRDIKTVKQIVDSDSSLKKQVKEIIGISCLGGILAEDDTGKVSIDNTYDTRLEMLLNRILPDIGHKLFGDASV